MRIHDVELARVVPDLDPRARYGPELEKAAELGARAVLSSIWTDDRDYYLAKFAEICQVAAELGMTVNLEFVPIAGVRTLAQAVDVLRTVNAPNAGLMIDIHHIHRSRDKVEDLDGLPAKWFNFCHLCDAPGDIPTDVEEMTHILRAARSYVGEGGIPVADYRPSHARDGLLHRAAQRRAGRPVRAPPSTLPAVPGERQGLLRRPTHDPADAPPHGASGARLIPRKARPWYPNGWSRTACSSSGRASASP